MLYCAIDGGALGSGGSCGTGSGCCCDGNGCPSVMGNSGRKEVVVLAKITPSLLSGKQNLVECQMCLTKAVHLLAKGGYHGVCKETMC